MTPINFLDFKKSKMLCHSANGKIKFASKA